MTSEKLPKVLVSAHAFSPLKGSEFAIGWDYVRAIAARNRVWVIARSNEKAETERYLREHPDVLPGLTVHYVPWTTKKWNFPLREIPLFFMYRHWQRRAYRLGRRLDAEVDFDVIHQVCPTGFREPGFLWKIGKPFIWGPVGGLQYFPVRLLNAIPFNSWWYFLAKNCTAFWSMHFAPWPKRAAARARLVIAGTTGAAERIRALWGREAPVLCEVSAPEFASSPPVQRKPGEKFRIIWSGFFEPRKALNIILLALHRLKNSAIEWELLCLGNGPLEKRWKKLASDLGIADRCRFLGRLPRAEAVAVMASGHCFVQPSLYDATSSVVVEALAMGVPVVCLDHFGFRDAVDATCGIRIKPGSLKQITRDFAEALEKLAQDEDLRHTMAIAAHKRSARFTWEYKGRVLGELYDRIVPRDSEHTDERPASQIANYAS